MDVPRVRILTARTGRFERPNQRIATVAAALVLALTSIVLVIRIADMAELQAAYAQGSTVLQVARVSLIATVVLSLAMAGTALFGRSIRGSYALLFALSAGNVIALFVAYANAERGIDNAARPLSLPGLALGSAVLAAIAYYRARGRIVSRRRFRDPPTDSDGPEPRGASLPLAIASVCLGALAAASMANPPQNTMDDTAIPSGNEYYPDSDFTLVADLCLHTNLSPVFKATTDEVEFWTELNVDDEDLNQRCLVQSPGEGDIRAFEIEVHLSYDATTIKRGGTCPWRYSDDDWGYFDCSSVDVDAVRLTYGHGAMLFSCSVSAPDRETRDAILAPLEEVCMSAAQRLVSDA